jgi:hypothetical protein
VGRTLQTYWEPAPRSGDDEYRRVVEGLQDREITPNDYDLLMNLEKD